MRIQEHTELEVYKKAFDAAVSIFLATRDFRRTRCILLLTKFVARLAQSVRIRQRRGASVAIKQLSSQNFQTRKPRLLKPRSGFNSQFRVAIFTSTKEGPCKVLMRKFSE